MSTVANASKKSGTRRVDELDSLFARRRRPWLWALFLILAAGGVGAWQFATRGPSEREPNHLEKDATRLAENTEMRAYLGQRLSEDSGDVDLFELVTVDSERRAVEIEVSGIPNMDVVVELLKLGTGEALIVSDSRGLGEGERLPNVPVGPGKYLIRVRERPSESELPTENVSDEYSVRWKALPDDPAFERELNDSLELAEPLELGSERRAWIGWSGDVDTFCLAEDADHVLAQVSALAEVDLVLRVVDRRTERSAKVDSNGVGRGETSKTWRNAEAGKLCIEISADALEPDGRAAHPDETYGVRFVTAPER